MIKRIAGWVVLVPLCLVLIVFSIANRQPVTVHLNPFAPTTSPADSAGVPLFLVIFGMLIIGVILGGIATWLAQGRHRRQARHWRRQYNDLAGRYETLRRAGPRPRERDLLEVDDLLHPN